MKLVCNTISSSLVIRERQSWQCCQLWEERGIFNNKTAFTVSYNYTKQIVWPENFHASCLPQAEVFQKISVKTVQQILRTRLEKNMLFYSGQKKKKKAFSFLSKASSGIFRTLEEGLEICLGENCFSSNEFSVYLCELSQVQTSLIKTLLLHVPGCICIYLPASITYISTCV